MIKTNQTTPKMRNSVVIKINIIGIILDFRFIISGSIFQVTGYRLQVTGFRL